MPTPTKDAPPFADITAAVLAGGRASRMGGQDKGLLRLAGRTMVEHVVDALRPQVGQLVVNANRNRAKYQSLCGCKVVSDTVTGFAGPLAGMASVMQATSTELVLTAPCDSPLIRSDLAARLRSALIDEGADVAVAHDGRRLQPVFALLRCSLLPSMLSYLESGERKIDLWYAQHPLAQVDFSDSHDMFLNINTPAERDALEARLLARAESQTNSPGTL